MRLYHGSNVSVQNPRILSDRRAMDFGNGFYLTSDRSQAIKWAQIKARRTGVGKSIVSVFQMDDNAFDKLSILSFSGPDKEWLAYVSANRRDKYRTDDFDIVVGPVANDRTMPTINLYLRGYITEDMTIELLLPQKLKDQYCFKTEKSLSFIQFEEAVTYD